MKELYHIKKDGTKCIGTHEKLNVLEETELYGDCTNIYGDLVSDFFGDCTNLSGDITGLWGDCTNVTINLDLFEYTEEDRYNGIYVENIEPEVNDYGLEYYVEDDDTKYVNITKIVVPTEYDKEQLLKASRYLHDCSGIDTDFYAINTLVHLYLNPDLIEVQT